MTRNCFLLVMVSGLAAWGQGRGPAPVRSPEVAADGRITFRLRAPNAKEVAVTGFGQRLAMQKDDQGVWSATTDPMKPDLYTYSFSLDGVTVNDPGNGMFKTSYGSAGQSLVRVPGEAVWNPGEGPKGSVTRHFYKSALIGDDREYFVYTPPNYDAGRKEPYPVFFLLHGLGDDAAAWLNVGAANVILDNLINQGKAKPMVMVATLGYGTPDGPRGAMGPGMIANFAKALVEEVLPQVEKAYRVTKDRNQRAIAGLSMGGAETVYTGLNHLDKFAWMASFSGAFVMYPRANPAPPPPPAPNAAAAGGGRGGRGGVPLQPEDFAKNFPALDAKSNSQIRMLWIACGTEDGLIGANRQFKEWLKTKNVHFTEAEIPQYAHVWPLWRQNLAEVAQQFFQAKAK